MKKSIILFLLLPFILKGNDHWKHYPHDGTFEPDSAFFLVLISNITEDKGTIYFGSGNSGIDILDPDENWSRLDYRNTPLPLFSEGISGLCATNGTLYAATDEGLLIVSESDTLLYTQSNSDITNSKLTHITQDPTGNIWFTSKSYMELTMFDGNSFHHNYIPEGIPMPNYNAGIKLLNDKHGNIWYLGIRSLVKFDGESYVHWDSTNSPLSPADEISAFVYDNTNDQFWATVSPYSDSEQGKSRLFSIKDGEWEEYDLSNMPFEQDSVRLPLIAMDNYGNIIFGVMSSPSAISMRNQFLIFEPTNDVWKVVEIPYQEFTSAGFLSYRSLFVDQKNNLWIGSFQDGVLKVSMDYILSSVTEEETFTGLPSIWIRSVTPNPVISYSTLEFFCEPDISGNLSIKIYDYLGAELKDITNDLEYDMNSATGIVYFNLNFLPQGIYFINVRSGGASKTISVGNFSTQ